MRPFEFEPARSPLLVSFPHSGTGLAPGLHARLSDAGRTLIDTDWHVDRLYDFTAALGIGTIRANVSRYVVDLNRDPHDAPLYPGMRTTGVCATESFAGDALYRAGDEPSTGEIAERVAAHWAPYHAALRAELEAIRARFGYALLVDGHSIWGRLPLLFDGELPDVNLGSNGGRACALAALAAVAGALGARYPSLAIDARFKGGYITRTYGAPADGVHAIQIELNQRTYLRDGSRTEIDAAKAGDLSRALRAACETLLSFQPSARDGVPRTTVPAQSVAPSQ